MGEHGQLGDGSRCKRLSPAVVLRGVARVAAGSYHCVAVTDLEEVLLAWGFGADNGSGLPVEIAMWLQLWERSSPGVVTLLASLGTAVGWTAPSPGAFWALALCPWSHMQSAWKQ